MIWIDTAYPVVPLLTWIGLAEDRSDLLQEAADQMRKMYGILLDRSCGQLHQTRGFLESGRLTEDHWSRGNGWALLALANVLDALPETNPPYGENEAMFRDLSTASILYGMGVGLRRRILVETRFSEAVEENVSGLIRYIALDGSIHNCCRGCLARNQGRIEHSRPGAG